MAVLICAPQPDIRRLLRESIADIIPDLLEAPSGAAMRALFQRQPANMVLMVWPVRDVDGTVLLRSIRAATCEAYPYVLLLGRADREAELIRGLAAGADDYLVTPFRRADLRRRMMLGLRVAGLEEQLHQLQVERDQLRTQDALTGLLTRQALYQRLSTLCEASGRAEIPLSLVLVRINDLQAINREHGYAVGNQAVQQLAAIVSGSVRQGDLVGRWSGPALLLVLPDTASEAARAVAGRVHARVALAPVPLPRGGALPLLVSVHVATTRITVRGNFAALVQSTDET